VALADLRVLLSLLIRHSEVGPTGSTGQLGIAGLANSGLSTAEDKIKDPVAQSRRV